MNKHLLVSVPRHTIGLGAHFPSSKFPTRRIKAVSNEAHLNFRVACVKFLYHWIVRVLLDINGMCLKLNRRKDVRLRYAFLHCFSVTCNYFRNMAWSVLMTVPLIIERQLDFRALSTVYCRGKMRLKQFEVLEMPSRLHIGVDEATEGYLCMLKRLHLYLNLAKNRAEIRIDWKIPAVCRLAID